MEIDERNKAARERAKKNGGKTYQHWVIDAWPGCVECGDPIRSWSTAAPNRRLCSCAGVVWHVGSDGWIREEAKP